LKTALGWQASTKRATGKDSPFTPSAFMCQRCAFNAATFFQHNTWIWKIFQYYCL